MHRICPGAGHDFERAKFYPASNRLSCLNWCQATRVRAASGGCREGRALGQARHQRRCRGLHRRALPGRSLVPCEGSRPDCHRPPGADRDRADRPVMSSPACERPASNIPVYVSMAANRRSLAAKSADEIGFPIIAMETSRC